MNRIVVNKNLNNESNENSESAKLLNDVQLLNAIVDDLNNCIVNQGEKIDSIENNIMIVENVIEKSNAELSSAQYYKKEINKKYLTLAGIGGILLILFVL